MTAPAAASAPYQLLPPLDPEERAALVESISTFGILQPVVVDEAGAILDGHHRKGIADELGIPCPTVTLPGLTEEQKVEQALALNLARRHLTPEQRQALVMDLRGRGLSIRFISEKTGIPRSTVHRVAAAVPGGTPEYVTGNDGKRYIARQPNPTLDQWRQTWLDMGVRVIASTGIEMREYLRAAAARLGFRGFDELLQLRDRDEAYWEDLLLEMLHDPAAGALIRTGVCPPPPPWYLARYTDSLRIRNAGAIWQIDCERAAGAFFNWCDERGIKYHGRTKSRGGYFELPENLDDADRGHFYCFLLPDSFWAEVAA